MTPDPTLIEQERPRCKMPDCDEPVYQLGVCSHHWEWLNGREPAATLQGSAALPSEAMTCADCGWEGSTETWRAGCKGFPCELRATTPTAPEGQGR